MKVQVPCYPRFQIEIKDSDVLVYRDGIFVDYNALSEEFPYARYGNGRCQYVKRADLVLSVFIGPKPRNHESCHIDGVKLNDLPDNLYWGTHAQNMADISKVKFSDFQELKSEGFTQKEIANILGVHVSSVERAIRRWKN